MSVVPHDLEFRVTPRPVVAASGYPRSRALLGHSPLTERLVTALETQAATRPHATAPVPGTLVRVLRARPYGELPSLRLFYSVDDTAVRLLSIEHYDQMEP